MAEGKLVAFPTETVYGIGANLLNNEAVDKLYEVKRRIKDKPFTIHITDKAQVMDYAIDVSPEILNVLNRFWPGPLTAILKSKTGGKVGLRLPKNKIAANLIKEAKVPIVATSANIFGQPPPVDSQSVANVFFGKIEMILNGGRTEYGKESTIVDFTQSPCQVVREGAIRQELILEGLKRH